MSLEYLAAEAIGETIRCFCDGLVGMHNNTGAWECLLSIAEEPPPADVLAAAMWAREQRPTVQWPAVYTAGGGTWRRP